MVLSPNGQTAASLHPDGAVTIWDVRTGQPRLTLAGHSGPVTDGAFTPDGRTLYTASLDTSVIAWDIAGNRSFGVTRPSTAQGPFSAGNLGAPYAGWSANRRRAVIGFQTGLIATIDVATGTRTTRGRPVKGLEDLALSPDGHYAYLSSTGPLIRRWNTTTGQVDKTSTLGDHSPKTVLGVSPDGRRLVACESPSGQRPLATSPTPAHWNASARHQPGLRPRHRRIQPGRQACRTRQPLRPRVQRPDGPQWQGHLGEGLAGRGSGHRVLTGRAPPGRGVRSWADGHLRRGIGPPARRSRRRPIRPCPHRIVCPGRPDDPDIRHRRHNPAVGCGPSAPRGRTLEPASRRGGVRGLHPDGKEILGLDPTGRVTAWPATVAAWLSRACSIARRDFTPQERTLYSITPASPKPCA